MRWGRGSGRASRRSGPATGTGSSRPARAGVFFAWFLDEGDVSTFRDHLGRTHARYARFAAPMLAEGVRLIPAGRWYPPPPTRRRCRPAADAADRALARLER